MEFFWAVRAARVLNCSALEALRLPATVVQMALIVDEAERTSRSRQPAS